MKTCSIDGCDRPNEAQTFCRGHYSRWKRHQDPLFGGPLVDRFDAKARFWAKVDKTETCWLWTGAKGWTGHGNFRPGEGRAILAHRFSWQIANGPIPEGKLVCHTCDVPACVNPDHLYVGTQSDNMRDREERGHTPRGTTSGMSKLSAEQVLAICELSTTGLSNRAIAKMFGVSHPTVGDILRGLSYHDVPRPS